MSRIVRGWKALAEATDRAVVTVREWPEKGCPYEMDKNVHVFDLDKVEAWNQQREKTEESDESDELKKERIRKTKLEASKLEHDEKVCQGFYDSVSEFERVTELAFRQIKTLMQKTVDDIKELSPEMTAAQEEKIDAALIAGFNEIAKLEIE